jgi:hypothetical protein
MRPSLEVSLAAALLLASACDGSGSGAPPGTTPPSDTNPPADTNPPVDQGPCPVYLSDLALYQTLKIPLVAAGETVAARPVDVVEGKAALVRAWLAPTDPTAAAVSVRARLTVTSTAGRSTIEDIRTISGASTETDLRSTLGFAIDGALVQSDTSLAVDILEPTGCSSKPEQARLPRQGSAALAPRKTGILKVVLVPVRYDADGSGRLPDTSAAQVERFRATLSALYPVATIDITMREVVGSSVDLAGSTSTGWSQFLDSIRGLRASDRAADDAYYYGLVEPAASLVGYCRGSCIAGISYQVSENRASLRAGVGLAFPGDTSALTMAHELGHQHGRGHAPCGATAGLDDNYPHAGGVTAIWGYDARTRVLIAPSRLDIMGYCTPQWISDYTYQALLERSAIINPASAAQLAAPAARDWQVLLVGSDGVVQRGQPLIGFAPPADSAHEAADLLGAAGEPLGQIEVYRLPLADVDVSMVLVPRMPAAARGLALKEGKALRLDLMSEPRALAP